jgi:hypothetical protein
MAHGRQPRPLDPQPQYTPRMVIEANHL